MDQITWTITLYTWPFFCNPWEEEIWYQYLGKWNRILKDWDPLKGNFIRNGFPQKSNSAFIVRSLQLYDKHLSARLRLYFNDTLIKKKRPKRNLGSNPSLSLQPLPSYTPPPHPPLPAQHHLKCCIFLLLSFTFFFLLWNTIYANKYCCCYWMGLWQREQSGLSLRYQVARYNSSSKWDIEQLGGSLSSFSFVFYKSSQGGHAYCSQTKASLSKASLSPCDSLDNILILLFLYVPS